MTDAAGMRRGLRPTCGVTLYERVPNGDNARPCHLPAGHQGSHEAIAVPADLHPLDGRTDVLVHWPVVGSSGMELRDRSADAS